MNSVLNPEAPEFFPHLTSVTQKLSLQEHTGGTDIVWLNIEELTEAGYTKVNKTIRSSNQLPSGASYDLFKTITDFNKVASQLSDNVVHQANQIMATELPAVKLKRLIIKWEEHIKEEGAKPRILVDPPILKEAVNKVLEGNTIKGTAKEYNVPIMTLKRIDIEYNTEKVTDANDSILDRINMSLDVVGGVSKPDGFGAGAAAGAQWSAAPVIAKIQVGSTLLIGAKNIQRPQLSFKDPIDNSHSLWVPRIADKPNNIKPLALSILYNDEGEAVGYEHPYKVELDLYRPPCWCLEPDPEPPAFPRPLPDTALTLVDSERGLDELVEHLLSVEELAVDVEHHSYRSYQGITCLVQISTNEGGDFLIDTLAIREHIHKLNLVFTDPKKIKVFHGAERDVLWLQRDFGVYVVGLFDTHQAARALALSGLSLKHLLWQYCHVECDKKYQLADWRIRPLPAELVEYARGDTHYLLYIWRRMKADLLRAAPPLLAAVFERSRQICGATYNKPVVGDDSHMPLYQRSKKSFNSRQLAALKMLYKWRDAQARELDEGDIYLLPNHMLLSLAETLPRDVQGVGACCSPTPPFVKTNLVAIHRMLLSCRELPLEPQLYPMPAGISAALNAPPPALQVHDLSHCPDYGEEQPINLDCFAAFVGDAGGCQPDVTAFVPTYNTDSYLTVVSELSVDAKQFIPPYVRYRRYRALAQMEEMKEYREKEAKIAAIGKGDELIKSEVLNKLQQAKSQIENDKSGPDAAESEDASKQRKRKIPPEAVKQPVKPVENKQTPNVKHSKSGAKNDVKPYLYKNANYKKFFDNNTRAHKPKTKFKKH